MTETRILKAMQARWTGLNKVSEVQRPGSCRVRAKTADGTLEVLVVVLDTGVASSGDSFTTGMCPTLNSALDRACP